MFQIQKSNEAFTRVNTEGLAQDVNNWYVRKTKLAHPKTFYIKKKKILYSSGITSCSVMAKINLYQNDRKRGVWEREVTAHDLNIPSLYGVLMYGS